ncbi:type II toxin-antitoxin system VapC family toxin [Chelatococcus reniformis]|uniref:Ribonuclease VapC n=1 Tax=Chelatococcus reniformis TaxID=1494448 RepID=A0A916XD73_9HYPH|nr:type II toxin-antitoxin system VapC family toxin [Chelatococcus reniformis]GGC61994.1 VapC ribonuclease [Chelatococcus reniformis]
MTVVVDASALVAILLKDAEAARLQDALLAASRLTISAFNLFEAHTVLLRSAEPTLTEDLAELVDGLAIAPASFDRRQSELAFSAYRRFGHGSGHPARLNLGDCAAYALAMTLEAPLLFKGAGLSRTDVEPALHA